MAIKMPITRLVDKIHSVKRMENHTVLFRAHKAGKMVHLETAQALQKVSIRQVAPHVAKTNQRIANSWLVAYAVVDDSIRTVLVRVERD
jgi:uncharacterized protein (DUF2342 family)